MVVGRLWEGNKYRRLPCSSDLRNGAGTRPAQHQISLCECLRHIVDELADLCPDSGPVVSLLYSIEIALASLVNDPDARHPRGECGQCFAHYMVQCARTLAAAKDEKIFRSNRPRRNLEELLAHRHAGDPGAGAGE